MAFKVLFVAHAPDADNEKHRNLIETGMYHLHSVVVKDQDEALQVSKEFADDLKGDCILLCPGFSNEEVAEISIATGPNVAVGVCRGDGPGNKITLTARKRAGYPQKKSSGSNRKNARGV